MNYFQEYLECYAQLALPQTTKQANRRLLEIEASEQAWPIAHSLLTTNDTKLHPHGCQLLSKKLNSPIPNTISPSSLLQFMYNLPNHTSQHWLCIAKLLLHINSKQCLLPSGMSVEAKLAILKEIPSAITQVRTQSTMDVSSMKKQYLEAGKSLFLEYFDSHRKQVLGCLDSFVSYNTRVQSEAIVLKLLQLPLNEVGFILQEILSHQKYPSLQKQLITFIETNSQQDNIFQIHLAFYNNIEMHSLTTQQFTKVLAFTINKLKNTQQNQSIIQDTYQFWQKIANQITQNSLTNQQLQIARQAFQILWDMICTRSLLKQVPLKCKVAESSLSINVDDDEGQQYYAVTTDINTEVLNFRESASDFMTLCLNVTKSSPQNLSIIFDKLLKLCNGTLLNLELGIFILVTVADIFSQHLIHAKQSVTNIFRRQTQFNEFICSKVIDLIAKLHSLFHLCPDLLPHALAFLARALNYENLSPLASQSCCELLEEVKTQASLTFTQNIQAFLSHIYEILFQDILKQRVIQNLAKAMVIFIFKFKHSPEYYQHFLQIFSTKISSLDNKQKIAKYIESAIIAQLWLNARDTSRNYLKPFETFLNNQIQFLMYNISTANRKPKFTQAVNLVNMAIKTTAVSHSAPWIQLVNQILTQFLHVKPPLPIIITPLINLAKTVEQLHNDQSIIPVVQLLGIWQPHITALLDNIRSGEVQFNLSNVILQLHLAIVKLFLLSNSYYSLISYSPAHILAFIATTLTSQIWEYELFKHALTYYNYALQLGCPPEPIICNVFANYGKLGQVLWTSVQPIIFLVHKSYGVAPILKALKQSKSTLNQENPLWQSFEEALVRSQSKTVKNLLLSII